MSKTDNKGFSLVELMIAVCILAVIVVPLFNSIISSVKVNSKSRQTLRATTLAQNEMEIFQKETIEALSDPEKYAYTETRRDGYHVDAPDDPGDNGCYTFSRKGIINDDSGKEMFDVYIKLNPQRAGTGEKYHDANNQSLISLNTIGTKDTATYMQQIRTQNSAADQDTTAYNYFYNNQTNISDNTLESLRNNFIKRNIVVDITQSELASKTYTKVKITYSYECTASWSIPANKLMYKEEHYIYDNSQLLDEEGNPTELKSVYLFFAPRYNVTYKDSITINNTQGVPADIYIVRQDILNESNVVQVVPQNYQAKLVINDVLDGEGNTKGRYHTNLNLGPSPEVGKGSPVDISLNGGGLLINRDQIIAATGLVSLGHTEKKDRIYSITVEVYAAGDDVSISTTVPIAKLTGTKIE